MGRPPALLLALVLTLALATPATAATHEVAVVDGAMSFAPDDVDALVGDAVHWSKPVASPIPHNIVQDVGLFFSGPVSGDAIDFTVVFSAGRFHYYCEQHGSPEGGMAGTVDTSSVMTDGPEGLPFSVRWASPATETGRAFDVRFKIGDGDWRVWKKNTERFRGTFGGNDRPVRVREGRTYTFRARSQLNARTGGAVSRWSPSLVVET